MKNICVIALKLTQDLIDLDCDYIGVETGALFLNNHHKEIKYIIGDLDSLTETQLKTLKNLETKIINFPKNKDKSDSQLAIEFALKQNYEHIIVSGGIGQRFDHTFNNMLVLEKFKDYDITFRDLKNKMFILKPGLHLISKSHYQYLSIFPLKDSIISTAGLKYEIKDQTFKQFDNIGLSNEVIGNFAQIAVKQGLLVVIQSSD